MTIPRMGEHALPDEEKDLLFLALGAVGDDDIVPAMAALLKPGWNPFKSDDPDWKRAASALVRLGTPRAREVLQEGGRSRNKPLSEVCFEALQTLQRAQSSEGAA